MTITPAALAGPVTLSTSLAALYTTPASTKAVIKKATFTNISASAATLVVTVTRSGGSEFAIIATFSIAAGQAYVAQELANLVLLAGDALRASAGTASAINAVVSGFTFT